jgi:signal transduction histidine kinase
MQSGFDTRSILCVPLQTKGQTIGALEVMNKGSGPFDENDVRLLSLLAAPAATAIENARLYHRAQREIVQRKRAEAAVEAERALLARRVAERTVELREANAELAEAGRLKDRFVSNVSHELRTPLSVITLLSGNLDMYYDRWDDDRRQQTIRDLREHARLLKDLIGSVLEISRIDSNCAAVERGQVDLAQLAREEVDKQLPLAQRKGQSLRVTGVEHLAALGNHGQLRQVIRNLLNNAIKYTPDGGEIALECLAYARNGNSEAEWPGAVDLSDDQWAALRVTDNGIGISQEDQSKLFERFSRVNAQGDIPGVGLGLSIAKELVELHCGRIAVSSTLGKGSVFAVYLPLSEE